MYNVPKLPHLIDLAFVKAFKRKKKFSEKKPIAIPRNFLDVLKMVSASGEKIEKK